MGEDEHDEALEPEIDERRFVDEGYDDEYDEYDDEEYHDGPVHDRKPPWLRPGLLIAAVLGLILIWVVLAQLMRGTEEEERSNQASSQPAPMSRSPEVSGAPKSLSGVNVQTDNVRRQLESLRKFVERAVQAPGSAEGVERLLAADFEALAIDRDRFGSRLDDALVQVSRWSYADSAPVFSGRADAFALT